MWRPAHQYLSASSLHSKRRFASPFSPETGHAIWGIWINSETCRRSLKCSASTSRTRATFFAEHILQPCRLAVECVLRWCVCTELKQATTISARVSIVELQSQNRTTSKTESDHKIHIRFTLNALLRVRTPCVVCIQHTHTRTHTHYNRQNDE